MSGRIELIIGPMYASKSSELIKITNRYKSIGKNILIINHILNNRYDTNNITTHDKCILESCLNLNNLSVLLDSCQSHYYLYQKAEIIIIEELQFFPDAYEFVTHAADIDNKIIIAAGLSGDFNRQPFENI